MRKTLSILAVTLLCTSLVRPAMAVPVLGQQLFYTGGDVTVEVLPASAGYHSNLHLYLFVGGAPLVFLGENHATGFTTTINPGADYGIGVGNELIFGIYVMTTGYTYYMGPGGRNPDEIVHAGVDTIGPMTFIVGFEDLFGGGDRDYDDNRFRFTGALTTAIAEPATLALLGLGLFGIGIARRRKTA